MPTSPAKLRDSLAAMDYSFAEEPCIYFIQNLSNKKCYVGSTTRLTSRIRSHFSELLRGVHHCQPLQRAFTKYGIDSFVWGVCEFHTGDQVSLLAREQHWIDMVGDYNTCRVAGSPRGTKMNLSDEEREARSIRCKSMVEALTEAQISSALERALAAKIGVPLTKEHKEKLSAATRGRPLSPEHKAKLTAINKSRNYSNEDLRQRGEKIKAALAARSDAERGAWKANISTAMAGRPSSKKGGKVTAEAKDKMREAAKGRVIPEAQREKIRASMLAKPPEWYQERAEKIREAKRRKREQEKTPA